MNEKFKTCFELKDIKGMKYSNMGITKSELCKLVGIDMATINIYDNWYLLDDKFYYYKNEFIFRELLMSELFNEINIRTVDFKLVKNYYGLGIISESYRTLEKEYYTYNDFCINYLSCSNIDLLNFKDRVYNSFGSKNTYEVMNSLYGMLAMDLFSGQVDRGEYNFFFECDDNSVRLAPLCDNGACLFQPKYNEFPFGNYSLSSHNFLSLLKFEKDFYYIVESILDINIYSILEKIIDKYKININEDYKKFILDYFDSKKYKINKSLKICR